MPIHASCYFSASELSKIWQLFRQKYWDGWVVFFVLWNNLPWRLYSLFAWVPRRAVRGRSQPFLELVTFLTAFVLELSQCSLPSPVFPRVLQVWRWSLLLQSLWWMGLGKAMTTLSVIHSGRGGPSGGSRTPAGVGFAGQGMRQFHSLSVRRCRVGTWGRECASLVFRQSRCTSSSWWIRKQKPKEVKWLVLGYKASLGQRQNLSSLPAPIITILVEREGQKREVRKNKEDHPWHTCLWKRPLCALNIKSRWPSCSEEWHWCPEVAGHAYWSFWLVQAPRSRVLGKLDPWVWQSLLHIPGEEVLASGSSSALAY